MKKVINGKLYDTFTAKFLGYFDNGKLTNYFSYLYEGLYQKRTGEHFLHCVGGALTTYNGSVIKPLTSVIKPLTYEEAQKWAEKHLDGDEYIKIFGDPEKNAEKTAISIDMQHGLPDNDIEDGNLAYVNYEKCSSVLEEAARETAFHLDFTAISIEDSSFDRDGDGASVYTAVLADDYHNQEVSDRFQFNLMKRAGLDIDLQKDGVEVKNFEDFRELRKPEELGLKIELLYAEYGDQEETISARALYGSNSTRSEELTLTSREQESLELFYNSEITPDKKEVQQEYDKEMS